VKDTSEYKHRYDISRHHAWAGGILLSVLLAIRILLYDHPIIIPIGVALIFYILVALFFTYKYSSGLATEQKTVQEVHIHSENTEIEKQKLKIEKKKAKAEAKLAKKNKND
jgi:hypothetical protein